MAMHDVSFVVPVFGTEEYLLRCLRSIARQTFSHKNIQVVVVDDCSPANTASDIVSTFRSENPELDVSFVRHVKNEGLYSARRTGVLSADGHYIFSLDSDDEIEPDLCVKLIKKATTDVLDIVQCRMMEFGPNGKSEDSFHAFPTLSGNDFVHLFLEGKIHWPMCGKLIRRDVYCKALGSLDKVLGGTPHINSMEDLLQFFPMVLQAPSFGSIDYFGYRYNVVSSSLSHGLASSESKWNKLCADVRLVRETILALAKGQNFSEKRMESVEGLFTPTAVNVLRNGIGRLFEKQRSRCLARWLDVMNPAAVLSKLDSTLENEAYKALNEEHRFQEASFHGETKRVAIVIGRFFMGGTERVISRLLSIWKQYLPHIRCVLVTFSPQTEDDFPIPSGVPRIVLDPDVVQGDLLWRFREIVNQYDIDTVLVSNVLLYHTASIGAWSRLSGLRTIGMIHGSFAYYLSFLASENRARNNRYAMFDMLTCVSKINAMVWRSLGLPQAVFVRNPPPSVNNCELPEQIEKHAVLFVGRLSEEKRPDRAIRAFAGIVRQIPDAKLYIVGAPDPGKESILAQCQSLATNLGISDSVVFCGFRADVDVYFRKTELLLLTSRYEGAPVVLAEAKQYGVPVVAMDLPYLDGIGEENGCVMTPQDDCDSMADAAVAILSDEKRKSELRSNARKAAMSFTEEQCAMCWREVFSGKHPHWDDDDLVFHDDTVIILKSFRDILHEYDEEKRKVADYRIWLEWRHRLDAEKRLSQISQSLSWRIGRALTWPLRSSYELFRSLQRRIARIHQSSQLTQN